MLSAQLDSTWIDSVKSLQEEVSTLDVRLQRLATSQDRMQRSLSALTDKSAQNRLGMDSLGQALLQSTEQSAARSQALGGQLEAGLQTAQAADQKIEDNLGRNTLYWIIGILVVAVLSLILFFVLRRRLDQTQTGLVDQLTQTREKLEAEGISLDQKLIDLLDRQMQLMQQERTTAPVEEETEVDHSLALKVADEIVRIEKNLSRMADGTKGLKQLRRSVNSIRDNFLANGYEMVEMLGKSFDEGMKVTATFIPDEDLNPEERIITRIIRPQVNHRGTMIQSAQIEVSQGS